MPDANVELRVTRMVTTVQIAENDPTLLLVAGMRGRGRDKEYVKKLAHAIVQTFIKHGVARMRCCGAASINNADKAYIIAKAELIKHGALVSMDQAFTVVEFDGEEKTGLLKEVWKSEDIPKGEE